MRAAGGLLEAISDHHGISCLYHSHSPQPPSLSLALPGTSHLPLACGFEVERAFHLMSRSTAFFPGLRMPVCTKRDSLLSVLWGG